MTQLLAERARHVFWVLGGAWGNEEVVYRGVPIGARVVNCHCGYVGEAGVAEEESLG